MRGSYCAYGGRIRKVAVNAKAKAQGPARAAINNSGVDERATGQAGVEFVPVQPSNQRKTNLGVL